MSEPFEFGQSLNTQNFDWGSVRFSESDGRMAGVNFNEFPKEFLEGITIQKDRWAVKFGGYVKADLIRDFDAISTQDFFEPSAILVGAPSRANSRFHAKQTRLSADGRWAVSHDDHMRVMVEADFYGAGDTLRLRHAFGEYQNWVLGQTWSTLTHRAALPNTLDNVGDVASIGRRQAQVRWSEHLVDDRLEMAFAIENSTVMVDDAFLPFGEVRTPYPDAVARLRWSVEKAQFQLAGIARTVGFQPIGLETRSKGVGGLNATSYIDILPRSRLYGGLLWGRGIGSYRELPDVALTSTNHGTALVTIAWYTGLTHQWNDRWSSNFTFSEGSTENTDFQSPHSIKRLRYLASNIVWHPTKHTFAGVEYLWGMRKNRNSEDSDANRVMMSVGFLFP